MRARRPMAAVLALASLTACPAQRQLVGMMARNLRLMVGTMRKVPNKIHHPYRSDARLAVLWVGHATMLIQMDDRFVLTDPVFTGTVGELSRRVVEPGMDIRDVPHVDVALISHLHVDHLSYESLHELQDRIGMLVVPEDALVYIPTGRYSVTELARWEIYQHDGLRVTAVPVEHSGWRYGSDIAWMTRSFNAYVIEYHGLTVYFGGDTAYVHEYFEETARRFPHIDLAMLPIAPIEPRRFMDSRHMDPNEALQAFAELGAPVMIPIHFDTFINSGDRIGEAPAVLRAAMASRGLTDRQVHILDIGQQDVVIPRR